MKPRSTIEELQALLRDTAKAAPPRGGTAYDTIRELLPDIRELKAKRYTDSEILDLFEKKGIKMALGTFRQYVQRAVRETGGEPMRNASARPKARNKKTPEATKSETAANAGAKANANDTANAEASAKPKPSDVAVAPRAKTGAGAKATGHRLSDDDL